MRLSSTAVACLAILGAPLAACGAQPAEGEAATPAAPVQADGAEAFVRATYATFDAGETDSRGPGDEVYSARLKALMEANAEVAKDEVGYFDGNPICNCQDWWKLTITSLVVTPTGPDRADAAIVFDNFEPPVTTRQTLRLVREDGAWKIDDIVWGPGHDLAGEPSMSEGLAASTAALGAGT